MSKTNKTSENAMPENAGRSLWSDAWRRLKRDKLAMVCMGLIFVYAVIAIISPFIFSDWTGSFDYDAANEPPSFQHPLGTDEFGRSVLQKTMLGAKVSMTVGFVSNIIAVPLGMVLGAIAGYYGRWIDDATVWLFTTFAAVPGIIRLVAIKFAFHDKAIFKGEWFELDLDGLPGLCIALGVTSWVGTCRLVRAETMKLREMDYVLAARATGRHGLPILLRHILPNLLHLGIICFSLGFAGAVMFEVTLSYLGLGVGAGTPSWGSMIDTARMALIVGRWWELASAVVAFFVLLLSLHIFGDRLRDALDPRLKNV